MSRALRLSRTPPSRHTLKLLIAPVIFLVICSNIAVLTYANLQDTHPLLLIALSSSNRFLLLVSDKLDPVSYYTVGTLRLLVSDPLFFLLGYWYGDQALEWMDKKSPTYGPMLRKVQRVFGRFAWLLVAVAPNNYICLFAGAAGMRISLFFVLNVSGTLVRLYLLRVVGDVFSGPLDAVQGFITRYQVPLIALSAVFLAVSFRNNAGGKEEIDELMHLDEELATDGAGSHESAGGTVAEHGPSRQTPGPSGRTEGADAEDVD